MDLPNELWFQIFNVLTQKSQAKFSCLWNLYNLSQEEIQLLWSSNNLWYDCVEKGYVKLFQILIQNDVANINDRDVFGLTAIHIASLKGHKDCVESLLRAGADVNVKNINGLTAIHIASLKGHKDCVESLLRAGADVNVKNINGWTALYCAKYIGYGDCVDVLIKHGGSL